MKIKETSMIRSSLNQFDLLGHDEVGLSKAFAYVIGKEPKALYSFLHYVGIKTQNTKNNFSDTSICTERFREEGRTDIEIKQSGKYHIIIESKVKSNKVKKQREQYINSFDDEPRKILCFITGINDFKKEVYKNIDIHNIGWLEIFNLFDQKEYSNNKLIHEFLDFIGSGYWK